MNSVSSLLERFEAGLSLLGRRSEPRFAANGYVQVFDGGAKGPLLETATLRNISSSGVCLAMMDALAPGHQVYLQGPEFGVTAVVRHTAVACNGFVVGLEFLVSSSPADQNPSGLPATW